MPFFVWLVCHPLLVEIRSVMCPACASHAWIAIDHLLWRRFIRAQRGRPVLVLHTSWHDQPLRNTFVETKNVARLLKSVAHGLFSGCKAARYARP